MCVLNWIYEKTRSEIISLEELEKNLGRLINVYYEHLSGNVVHFLLNIMLEN